MTACSAKQGWVGAFIFITQLEAVPQEWQRHIHKQFNSCHHPGCLGKTWFSTGKNGELAMQPIRSPSRRERNIHITWHVSLSPGKWYSFGGHYLRTHKSFSEWNRRRSFGCDTPEILDSQIVSAEVWSYCEIRIYVRPCTFLFVSQTILWYSCFLKSRSWEHCSATLRYVPISIHWIFIV